MNQNSNIQEQIKKLITDGKIPEAFPLLHQHFPNAIDTITILEAEYNELRNAELKNLLDFSQIQIRKNQINDKLLAIAKGEGASITQVSKISIWKILIPITILLLGGFYCWMSSTPKVTCPDFPPDFNNNILVIPFEKVAGNEEAKPQKLFCTKINELTKKYELSSFAKIGAPVENLLSDDAEHIAKQCQADLIVWGDYSGRQDSLHIILNYLFPNDPNKSNSTEHIALKDVMEIHKGKMSKNLNDAILSLCGIIALREGNNEVARNWFEKIERKEEVDERMLEILN